MDNKVYINVEEFKHLLNNSKYYGTEIWDDICNMLYNCEHYAQRNSSSKDIYDACIILYKLMENKDETMA